MYNIKDEKYEPIRLRNVYAYFVSENPSTVFNTTSVFPKIDESVFIGPFSSVIGDVNIEKDVFVGCSVVLRADEGSPFYIGCGSNIQDGVIFHGLKNNKFYVNDKEYSIYVGRKVSIAHGALIHGPVIIGNHTFVGFRAVVSNAIVEDNCYIDTGAIVTSGVRISEGKYVPVGAIVDTQKKADNLLSVSSEQVDFSGKVVDVNMEFGKNYK